MLRDSHVVAFTTCITTVRRKCKETWDECVIDMPQVFIIIVSLSFSRRKESFLSKNRTQIKRGSFSKARWLPRNSSLSYARHAMQHTYKHNSGFKRSREAKLLSVAADFPHAVWIIRDKDATEWCSGWFQNPQPALLAYISVRWLRRLFMGFCPII